MRERERYGVALSVAESMVQLWELENRTEELDCDKMMRRLKDLSAYSLTHAEIMDQREGVELLALAMFFGATSNPRFHRNQTRLSLLSEQTIAYRGEAEVIEKEIAQRKPSQRPEIKDKNYKPLQPRLF